MTQLKNTYGDSLLGILVYIKDKGVDIRHAEICHPFDYFFDIFPESRDNPDSWDDLVSKISEFLEAENE